MFLLSVVALSLRRPRLGVFLGPNFRLVFSLRFRSHPSPTFRVVFSPRFRFHPSPRSVPAAVRDPRPKPRVLNLCPLPSLILVSGLSLIRVCGTFLVSVSVSRVVFVSGHPDPRSGLAAMRGLRSTLYVLKFVLLLF